MSSDGDHFNFDVNKNDFPIQQNRHSPPALDAVPELTSPTRRPPNLFLPRQGSIDYSRYEQILKNTNDNDTIYDMPDHIKKDVIESLNILKENRTDWRQVASRLGMKSHIIERIEREYKDDPTHKVFQELSHERTTELLKVLIQMNRHDVLNIFYEHMCTAGGVVEKRKHYEDSKLKNPSQESTPVSGSSSTSELVYTSPTTPKSPCKDTSTPDSADLRSDSGIGSTRSPILSRQKTNTFAKQNTDEDLAHKLKSCLDFHSTESSQFWHEIPPKPESTRKEWKCVEELMKKKFKTECMQSQLMRFICYVLKIEPYEERHNKYVHDHDFANLVAWFGPIMSGPQGCFAKIAELTKRSTTYKGNSGPHSFFAGYMTKEEADRLIGAEETIGSFLIRFSSTYANEGSFVIALKTEIGVEHIVLQGNPRTGKITFDGKEYDDLIKLWRNRLCKGGRGVSTDGRTWCTTTCPNLPLNALFKAYGAGPRLPQSWGRGRGRGRTQEQ